MSDTDKTLDMDTGEILYQRFIAETDRRERNKRKTIRSYNYEIEDQNNYNNSNNNINNNRNIAANLNRRETGELRRTLSNLLSTIENELRNTTTTTTLETERRQDLNPNLPDHDQDETPDTNFPIGNAFVPRPSFFSLILRNLLLLDYFIMLVLFPFSLYNIIRISFNSITLSKDDFILDIITYLQNSQVISNNDNTLLLGFKDGSNSLGLLAKFHNVLVFYGAPAIRAMLHWTKDSELVITLCNLVVRGLTVLLYLVYGLGGTVYMGLACFFFVLSLGLTVYRRFQSVHQILADSLSPSVQG